MKYVSQNWSIEDDGVLYFFQRLQEMLFHYSNDITRMPVHNSISLILEYLSVENEVNNDRVREYQLDQILEELKQSLSSDKILHENLGSKFVESTVKELRIQKGDLVQYLCNKMPGQKYYEWSRAFLKKHAVIHTHKEEIECGVRAWIVEVVRYGYKPEYVYNYLCSIFSEEQPDAKSTLYSFLDHFSFELHKFRIYFTFKKNMRESRGILSNRIGIIYEDDGEFSNIKKGKNDFVGFLDEEAMDRYVAVDKAYAKIETYLKFYRVISNRKHKLLNKMCLVKAIETGEELKTSTEPSGYRAIEIEPKTPIANLVDKLILSCQKKPRETIGQINKIINLHNEAIRQVDLSDGFVNLWSILEVVSMDTIGKSKIEKIINGIVPVLEKDYLPAVFENVESDLKDNLNEDEFENLLHSIQQSCESPDLIACFIFLPQFEQLREEYFKKLEKFPIIRTKIYRLWEVRDSKLKLQNLTSNYTQRIKWHMYRLYRARNSIVHSGDTPKQIQILGEHLHVYIDRIITEILVKLATERTLQTISDILIDAKLSLQDTSSRLKQTTPIDLEDIACIRESYFYKSTM